MARDEFEYDVALSFAGEDRVVVEKFAQLLKSKNIKYFYDETETNGLWGKDLIAHLADIYGKKARFCVMFLSQYYPLKKWTRVERVKAQERALRDANIYVLPLRLDDTELPGIAETTGYRDIRQHSLESIVNTLEKKLATEDFLASARAASGSFYISEANIVGDHSAPVEQSANIFISYARTDIGIVQRIYKTLLRSKHYPWMDVYSIKGGENWLRAIYRAIDECQIFLAILSNNSVSRRGVIQKELKKALDKWEGMLPDDIYILPLRIDDCQIPELLQDIQVTDWKDGKGRKKLLEAIGAGLVKRQVTPLATPVVRSTNTQSNSSRFGPIPMPKRKRKFTQLEKDRFAKLAFNYIKKYFQKALQELQNSDSDLQAEFDSMTSLRFTSKIYLRGNIKTRCSIWLGDDLISNTIYYNEGINQINEKAINDYLPVVENGEELGLQVANYAFSMTFRTDASPSTQPQAAEYLWKRFISHLEY